jgi:preprotein translocase subunit SecY
MQKKSKGADMEKKLSGVVSIVSFIGAFFFLSVRVTGNAVAGVTSTGAAYIGGVLFLIGIIAALFYFREKTS